jgi:phenylpyruvate tautomerase PptA (4-oxalocrotonate tautomerase family)
MPILDVQILGEMPGAVRVGLARRLADVVGELLGAAPGHTWVRLHWLPREDYAENACDLPETVEPVFVTVLKRELPASSELRDEIRALTRAVAQVLGRAPENVHVLYEPPAAGRIAFGGEFVE